MWAHTRWDAHSHAWKKGTQQMKTASERPLVVDVLPARYLPPTL